MTERTLEEIFEDMTKDANKNTSVQVKKKIRTQLEIIRIFNNLTNYNSVIYLLINNYIEHHKYELKEWMKVHYFNFL